MTNKAISGKLRKAVQSHICRLKRVIFSRFFPHGWGGCWFRIIISALLSPLSYFLSFCSERAQVPGWAES